MKIYFFPLILIVSIVFRLQKNKLPASKSWKQNQLLGKLNCHNFHYMYIVTKQIHYSNIITVTIKIKSILNFVYFAFCLFSSQINDLKYVGRWSEDTITLSTNIMTIAITPITQADVTLQWIITLVNYQTCRSTVYLFKLFTLHL